MTEPRPYKDSMDGVAQSSDVELEGSSSVPVVGMRLDLTAAEAEPLKVYLRLRPRAQGRMFASPCLEALDAKTLVSTATLQDNQQRRQFTFTKVFPELSRQEDIFEEVLCGPLESFLSGRDVLLFAYGPTGSGKTYTMQGTPEQPGVIPRTLEQLFRWIGPQVAPRAPATPLYFNEVRRLGARDENRILKKRDNLLKQQRARNAAEYSTFLFPSLSSASVDSSNTSILPSKPREVVVWVSCYEIYNENIYDLLVPLERGQRRTLKLGEDRNHRSYVKDLTEVPVQTAEDAYGLFCTARRNLSIAETRLNQSSSRSHCMFNVRLVRCDEDGPAVSCLTLCDLAGSENPTKTGNMGSRLREAGRINNSLLVLGRCLEALRLGKGAEQRAPFRDSKLTQVMQSFFVGDSTVSLIVNVSPSLAALEESLGALKFSAIATAVVPVPADSCRTKCQAAVRRLTQVWQRSTCSDGWSSDSEASERTFDEDNMAELLETAATLQKELEKAQQMIAYLENRVKQKEAALTHSEYYQKRMDVMYEELIEKKVQRAQVCMKFELNRKYRAQRKELVKARMEIARLRGETQPPRLSNIILPGDSEDDDSSDDDNESPPEQPTSPNAPSRTGEEAPAEVRRSLQNTLQVEVENLRVQLEELSVEKALFEGATVSELDSLRQELADTKMERDKAERDADNVLDQLQQLQEEHREALSSVELLKDQLASTTEAQEMGAQELARLTSQYQQLRDINADLEARLSDMAEAVQSADTLCHQVEQLRLQLDETSEKQELSESGKLEAERRLALSEVEHRRQLKLLRQECEAKQRAAIAELQSKVDELSAVCAELEQKRTNAELSREKAHSDAERDKNALSVALAEMQAALNRKEGELERCKELLKSREVAQLTLVERMGTVKPKMEISEEVDENKETGARQKTTAVKSERPRRKTRQVVDAARFEDDGDFVTPRRVTRSRVKKSSVCTAEQNCSILSEANRDTPSSPLHRFAGYVAEVFSRASAASGAGPAPRTRLAKADPDFVDLTEVDSPPTYRKSSRRLGK